MDDIEFEQVNNIPRHTDFVKGLVDDKNDPALGYKVRAHLTSLGLEPALVDANDMRAHPPVYHPKVAYDALKEGIYNAYQHLGLDVARDPSLKDTPKRFAAMFVGELTKGLNYDFFPKCTATPNGVEVKVDIPTTSSSVGGSDSGLRVTQVGAYDQMVLVNKIRITSLCEHHLQTIDGFAHIAYVPNEKVIGLSKLARVAEFFAARPQIQERMTDQIYHALSYILGTQNVAVSINATHFCMRARGVKQPESGTTTNKMGGLFMTELGLREEFLNATR